MLLIYPTRVGLQLLQQASNSNYTLINGNLATGQKANGVLGNHDMLTGAKYNHNVHLSYKADNQFLNTGLTPTLYHFKESYKWNGHNL